MSEPSTPGGLRERKKAKTKLAIQAHAVRLFHEQGYAATTMDQIAEAAEVSPSTVFRYFATKEELVTTDEFDPVIFAAFATQPAELSLVRAWRGAMHAVFDRMTDTEMATEMERMRLVMSVPELWAGSLDNITNMLTTMTELSARRVGRETDDPAVRGAIGAIFGVLLITALEWGGKPETDLLDMVDTALEQLEAGQSL